MTNQIQKANDVKSLMYRDDVQMKFSEIFGDIQKSKAFIVSVLNAVQSNEALKRSTPESVLFAAATAATLNLPINQNLGFAYIIPYKTKVGGNFVDVAQFQIGYKGLIQLCQRSGQFKTISASAIYEGQLESQNPLTGFIFDFEKKASDKVIGYAAYFELLNGFNKTMYMTLEQVKEHAKKYSKTFGKDYGVWATDFNAMAEKTVLKLLLSKYAPMTVDIQKAVTADQSVVNDWEANNVTYIDNDGELLTDEQNALLAEIEESAHPDATKQLLIAKVKEGKINDVCKFLGKEAKSE